MRSTIAASAPHTASSAQWHRCFTCAQHTADPIHDTQRPPAHPFDAISMRYILANILPELSSETCTQTPVLEHVHGSICPRLAAHRNAPTGVGSLRPMLERCAPGCAEAGICTRAGPCQSGGRGRTTLWAPARAPARPPAAPPARGARDQGPCDAWASDEETAGCPPAQGARAQRRCPARPRLQVRCLHTVNERD